MQVLHVSESLPGGIASYLSEIVPYQNEVLPAGVSLLVPADQMDCLVGFDANIFAYKRTGRNILSLLTLFFRYLSIVRLYKPVVVHAHSSFAGLVVRLASFFTSSTARPKVVYCAHGWAFDREGKGLSSRLALIVERLLSLRADSIVCISNHDYRVALAAGLRVANLCVIENAISDVESLPSALGEVSWPDGVIKILFVGRFDRQKGFDIFLGVMRRLDATAQSAFALAIGEFVVSRSSSDEIPSNVRVLGWRQRIEVADYMAAADFLIVPSRWEGFGLVAIEALRAGCPVLAARVGGLADIVEDGISGFLFEPENLDSILSAIRKFIAADREKLRDAARERFLSTYTSARLNRSLIGLYSMLGVK
jgi:glycosyltransferase involved in cell wall biosynthesis